MTHTELMIQEMADAMLAGGARTTRDQYVEALNEITRLAVAEAKAAPILAACADVLRVDAIRRESKYG